MITLTVRLPEDLRADLETISAAEHKAVSDIVRESIRSGRGCDSGRV